MAQSGAQSVVSGLLTEEGLVALPFGVAVSVPVAIGGVVALLAVIYSCRRSKAIAGTFGCSAGCVRLVTFSADLTTFATGSLSPAAVAEVKLPNDMTVYSYQKAETDLLYKEIFLDDTYTRNGIEVKPGATVFDVGGNVGMFSLFMNHLTGGDVTTYAFEPMPAVFRVLKANLEKYSRAGENNLHPMQFGLSDSDQHVEFDFHPNMSLWSTADSDFDAERAKRFDRDIAPGLKGGDNVIARMCPHFILVPLVKLLFKYLGKVEKVPCHLRLMSDIIEEENVSNIDLLKVDVEGSEMAVLRGIRDEHWGMIQQVVLEVETFKLVDEVSVILKKHGFEVSSRATERESVKGDITSEVSTVFGIRK